MQNGICRHQAFPQPDWLCLKTHVVSWALSIRSNSKVDETSSIVSRRFRSIFRTLLKR